jgi:hypothetical protein
LPAAGQQRDQAPAGLEPLERLIEVEEAVPQRLERPAGRAGERRVHDDQRGPNGRIEQRVQGLGVVRGGLGQADRLGQRRPLRVDLVEVGLANERLEQRHQPAHAR